MKEFWQEHRRDKEGRLIVPLPRRPESKPIGESRTQAVTRFMNLERTLKKKGQKDQFNKVMQEYVDLDHAEPVPVEEMNKPTEETYYLPIHVVNKESSTTTKMRAVFDASAKSRTGVSLNDSLLVGPTVHSPLINILMFFRSWRIGLVADVSKMYRGIMLVAKDKDLHRFLWRKDTSEPLKDYRMKRVTFGVSSSSFVANMCLKQNALDFQKELPLGAMEVERSFYVDDGLTGADNVPAALKSQKELQELFRRGGFTLHKWNSNDQRVLKHIDPKLRSDGGAVEITGDLQYTKTLGLQWKCDTDQFHVTVSESPSRDRMTKRQLLSDISRLFDVLGWFSPTIVKVKILQQRLWEIGLGWDQPIPLDIENSWRQWREELPELIEVPIPRCYHPREVYVISRQLHGFSDASENAYSAVIYLRMIDTKGAVHSSLVTSKTKVAPIKRLTIPRLELCGCGLLARLMSRVREVLGISLNDVRAWTDSTIVLGWLSGSPRRFKTFVGNRVSAITSEIPPSRWGHVPGIDNPADCASRGISPLELITHPLWWKGPDWMVNTPKYWQSHQFRYRTIPLMETLKSAMSQLHCLEGRALWMLRSTQHFGS